LGCAPSPCPDTWTAAEGLQDAAQDAADAWCEQSRGRYCPIVNDPSGEPIRWSVDADPTVESAAACGWYVQAALKGTNLWREIVIPADFATVAWPDGSPRCLWRDAGDTAWATPYATLVAILSHELGHAAGIADLRDAEAVGTLMGCDHRVMTPTATDVALLP